MQGYVYILVNSAMPGLVKIGRTVSPPSGRALALSAATGVPHPFKVAHCELVSDCIQAEWMVHHCLRDRRVSGDREFFKATVEEAVAVLQEQCGTLFLSRKVESNDTGGVDPAHERTTRQMQPPLLRQRVGANLDLEINARASELGLVRSLFIERPARYPRYCLIRPHWPLEGRDARASVCLEWDLTLDEIVPYVGVRVQVIAGQKNRDPLLQDLERRFNSTKRPAGWWAVREKMSPPIEGDGTDSYARLLSLALVDAFQAWADVVEGTLQSNGYLST